MKDPTDRQLTSYMTKCPDAPHLRPLSQTVIAEAMAWKTRLQEKTSSGERVNPVSAISMVRLILKIERLYTRAEREHRTSHGGQ